MVREERGIENDVILWEMRGMRRRGRPITTSVAYPDFFSCPETPPPAKIFLNQADDTTFTSHLVLEPPPP